MGGTDGRELYSREFIEGALYECAVLAHDVAVIAHHLWEIARCIHLVVDDGAVEGSEAPESVAAEQGLFLAQICHHGLGPVYHGGEGELQCGLRAKAQGVAVLDGERAALLAIESLDHRKGLGVAHDDEVGIYVAQYADGSRVVGLHMVDNEIVGLAAAEQRIDMVYELERVAYLHAVDDGAFLAPLDEI